MNAGQDSPERRAEMLRILVKAQGDALDDIEAHIRPWEDDLPQEFMWLHNRLNLMRRRVRDALRVDAPTEG